jgi:Barstar (barnase inhibitor)
VSTDRPDKKHWGAPRSGIYRAPDARGLSAADAPGLDVVPISLSGVDTKEALLERFAAALSFPAWFGGNWDALEDCLGDLSWRADAGRLLVIDGFEPIQAHAHDDFRVLVDLLGDVARDWSNQGRAFFVVFVDPEGRVALPALNDTTT